METSRTSRFVEGGSRHLFGILLDGEQMACLCAEFGNSRKTGHKIYERYKDCVSTG